MGEKSIAELIVLHCRGTSVVQKVASRFLFSSPTLLGQRSHDPIRAYYCRRRSSSFATFRMDNIDYLNSLHTMKISVFQLEVISSVGRRIRRLWEIRVCSYKMAAPSSFPPSLSCFQERPQALLQLPTCGALWGSTTCEAGN